MADDAQEPTEDAGGDGSTGPAREASAAAAGADDPTAGERDLVTGHTDPDDTDIYRGVDLSKLTTQIRNKLTSGVLIIHFTGRDVSINIDGDTALRTLRVLAGKSTDMDRIDTQKSEAAASWFVVDGNEVLGAQWIPDTSLVPQRVTMDPTGGLLERP